VEENTTQKKFNRKWLIVAAGVFGVSLISAGVFASTQITVNGNNTVNLGAGSATFTLCSSTATISANQTYFPATGSFNTTTFSITGLGPNCAGKVLSLAFLTTGSVVNSATWSVPNPNYATYSFQYGYGSNGSQGNGVYQSQSPLAAFDTAQQTNLSTVAIAVQ